MNTNINIKTAVLNRYLLAFLFAFTMMVSLVGQESSDDLRIYDHFQPVEDHNIFRTEGYYNWGGSIIKAGNRYHLFYSRWKKEYGFTGWLTHSEVAHATSKNPAGPWKFKEVVLTGRKSDHWDAITAHNPKIKFFDGKYYLYYIATNFGNHQLSKQQLIETAQTGYKHPRWAPLRSNQRTGVAVSSSLNGPWKRQDQPLIEPSGPIETLTVNPAITKGKDGRYYLIVKGDKPNDDRFIRHQAIAISDRPDGPFEMQEKPVIDYMDTEDVSVWFDDQRNRFYAVFHAHHYIGMITSEDGLNWKKSNEFILKNKGLQRSNGEIILPERMERPFLYTENGQPKVLCTAVKKGNDSYTVFVPINYSDYPVPNHRQLAWQEAELGVVYHYDLHVFDGKKYRQHDNRIEPFDDYQAFKPTQLDTDQWVKAAKDAGATFAILTATHETGFALYPSKVNPYNVSTLEWKDGQADIVGDFVASCRKYGIKPGIYLGIRWNAFFGVHDFRVQGEGHFREQRQAYYNKMVEGMVKEICTNYGDLFEIWFDGGADHPDNGAPDVLPIVRQYQPNCLFYHNGQLAEARWGGSESGTVSYPSWSTFPYRATGAGESAKRHIYDNNYKLLKEGDPEGAYWMPAMSDAPLRGYNGRHEWFWEPGDEAHIFPLENLVEMYYKSVGRNSTLILGLTPDPTGLLPEADVKRLKEWGDEIKSRFSNELGSASSSRKQTLINLSQPSFIDQLVVQEDIQFGESVRSFTIEALINGKWKQIAEGQSIGHKRIIRIEPVKTNRVRLKIENATLSVRIKKFSVYYSGVGSQESGDGKR